MTAKAIKINIQDEAMKCIFLPRAFSLAKFEQSVLTTKFYGMAHTLSVHHIELLIYYNLFKKEKRQRESKKFLNYIHFSS